MSEYKIGSPLNSKKHHLFLNGDSRSLCGKWLWFGEQYGDALTFGGQKYDCRQCAQRYAKARGLPVLGGKEKNK